jgi:hypothetical protein
MRRIATLTAVVTMAVTPAAFAATDLRAPDQQVASPHAVLPGSHAQIDLRSPDTVNGFVSPAATPASTPANDGNISGWAMLAIIAAAFGACGLLTVMLRRHFEAGRPLGA